MTISLIPQDLDELKQFIEDLEEAIASRIECKNALQHPNGTPKNLTIDKIVSINQEYTQAHRALRKLTGSHSLSQAFSVLLAAKERLRSLGQQQQNVTPLPQVGTRNSLRTVSGGLPGLGRPR